MSRKRLASSDSNPDSDDSLFWSKRIVGGSTFDIPRVEPSQQAKPVTLQLDRQRAESSRRHVRALNTQFASWVQTQLKNHPDELWEDGVRDYLSHASGILEKFSDVVNWLKANPSKGEIMSAAGPDNGENKLVSENKSSVSNSGLSTPTFVPSGSSSSFPTSWTSGLLSNNQSSKVVTENKNDASNLFQSKIHSTPSVTNPSFGTWSSVSLSSSQPLGFFNAEKKKLPENKSSETKPPQEKPVFPTFGLGTSTGTEKKTLPENKSSETKPPQEKPVFPTFGLGTSTGTETSTSTSTNTSFSSPWSSGVFSGIQTPVFPGSGIRTSAPANTDATEDGDEEPAQPSSPSLKKSEEKGINIVHEVKCKIFVKSTDPADKDPWKDKGAGQLSIRCKEGLEKGSKESKATILVRNDTGRVLLNALLYPSMKTVLQKTSIVVILHTANDANEEVQARTFLIRTKSVEDRDKLNAAIQEYAPSS